MNQTLWKAWELFINVLDCTLIVLLLTSHLKLKKDSKLYYVCAVLTLTVICTLANLYCDFLQTLVVLTVSLFVFTQLFTKGGIGAKIFWTVFTQVVFFGVDMAHNALVSAILGDVNAAQFANAGSLRLFNMVFTRFVLCCIVFFISKKKTWAANLNTGQTVLLCLCPAISCFSLICLVRLFYYNEINGGYVVAASIFICVVNLLVFLLYRTLTLQYDKLQQSELLVQKKHLEEIQYLQTISSYERLRVWKHDMANHMLIISELAQKEDTEALNKYVASFADEFKKDGFSISTGNTIVDAVVNNKVARALDCGIAVSLDIACPKLECIKDVDLCSIIGNVLDNAIEACEDEGIAHKYIQFRIYPKGNYCVIHSRNSSADKRNSSLVSSKRGTEHGMGISRIKQLVRDYRGWYDFRPEENSFAVELLLPVEPAESSARVVWESEGYKAQAIITEE